MNVPLKILVALLFSHVGSMAHLHAADSTVWRIKKSVDFEITGDGKSANWNIATWLDLPKRDGGPVSYETKLKILYSDSGIYCLYYCEDRKITATLTEDFTDLYNEDVVEAFFWTDEQTTIYFEYELSPLNYELPILVPTFNGKFYGWRPWHYEGSRKTRHAATIQRKDNQVISWTGEFFIPFKLLHPLPGVPARKGTRWRANFYRIDYDQGPAEWSWRPTQTNFHEYKKFGVIVFD
jgi:Carbohydrate-binding family 9